MENEYTREDINDAINRITSCLNYGYVDFTDDWDDVEIHIIAEALKLYIEKFKKEND